MKLNMPDGAILDYEVVGSGQPLMLLHGLALNRSIWKPVARLFRDERFFILPDIRGQGKSTLGKANGSLTQIVDDLVRLLDHLKIEKTAIGGHSMGGYIALTFAKNHADRVSSIALVTSNARADSADKRAARIEEAGRVLEEGVEAFADTMAVKLTRRLSTQTRVRKVLLKTEPEGLSNILRAIADRENNLGLIASLPFPVVAIFGKDDQIAPAGIDDEIRKAAPAVKLVRLPGVGHMPMFEAALTLGTLLMTLD